MAARQAMAIPPARGPAILAAWGPVLKGAPALAEWSEDQILAWIISRRETKLTPEMPPKIEWARQELTKAVTKELNKMLAQSVAIDHAVLQGQAPHGLNEGVFRISGLRSGALAHFLRIGWLTPETIKWDDITGDPEGVKRLWPARETNTLADRQLYAEDGSEPAAHAKESMPEPASPVESEPALPTETPHVELALVSSAPEVESRTPLPTTPPDEPTLDQVESDASDNSARPPSVEKLKAFVATYIKDTKASGKVPTKQGLCDAARDALPGATRKRLHDEYEKQTPTLSPGRPRKEHK